MRIAFDIHGTLDSDEKLRYLVMELNADPYHEIFIISGPPFKQIEREIELLKIDLIKRINKSNIISVVDYLKNKGVPMWKRQDSWWCDEEIWWESKGLICDEYYIDFMVDDKIRYKRNMPDHTKFILWIG